MRIVRLPTLRIPTLGSLRQFALTVGGLGALSYSAWTLHPTAGYAAGGTALLLLNWLAGDPAPSDRRPR